MSSTLANRLSNAIVFAKNTAIATAAVFALTGTAIATAASESSARAPSLPGAYAKVDPSVKSAPKLIMLGTPEMRAAATTIELGAMDTAKIEAVKKSNSELGAKGVKKALQIGITRTISDEAPGKAQPALRWNAMPDGSRVAYLRVKAAGAKSLRVGLELGTIPAGVEMRVVGTESAADASAHADANELNTLKDGLKLYWTPVTEGETQIIEIVAPKGIDGGALKLKVHSVSHFIASLKEGLSALKAVNDCTVDVACAPASTAFNNAKESVAHIVFQGSCGQGGAISNGCICTGTLLNDDVPTSEIPYFWGAHHCIETQTAANTINFYWFYQNATCQNPRFTDVPRGNFPRTAGGATLLYSDRNTDGAFMRMNASPPAGVFYSGWDANTIGIGENVTVIHHSDGDPKRYSVGVVDQFRSAPELGANGSFVGVRYTQSTVLGGGSGGAIMTLANIGGINQYLVRGGLLGGTATCGNSGLPANAGNLDVYSRFDQIFPSIRQFLLTNSGGGQTNYTDMWWNANESGWGFQVTHHPGAGNAPGNIFGTWYTYDEAGNQLFVTLSGCDITPFNGSTCAGRIYRATGTPYNAPVFTGTRSVTAIGVGTLNFTSSTTGSFTYQIGSTTITKNITRFPFGTGFATYPNDASDVYYQADASGWGYSVAQHGNTVFGVIYHYDEAGNPMWATVSGNLSGGAMTGALFRARSTTGSHYLSPTWRAADVTAINVGSATMFVNGNALNLQFTINGFTQTRTLTRLPF
jgi:lysyl endopeptidase